MSATFNEYVGTAWLAHGERGASSEAMYHRFTGLPIGRYPHPSAHPHDPADFRRCELLLRAVPVFRLQLPTMASVSPVWAALVAHWDELVALLESEIPSAFTGHGYRGSAPGTYARMRELAAAAQTDTFTDTRADGDRL